MLARSEPSPASWSTLASTTFRVSPHARARALVPWILAAALCALVGLAALTQPGSQPRTHAAAAQHTRAIPAGAQGVVSETIGRDERGFWARRGNGGFLAANRAQGFSARFTAAGVLVATTSAHVSLALRGYGHEGALRVLAPAAASARANRVVYAHPGLEEWYVNGPLGIEQGFTLARRPPPGREPLVLELRSAGALATRSGGSGIVFRSAAGKPVLRYGALSARDARGHPLPASLSVHGHELSVRVDDRHAAYPLTIDPKLTNPQKFVPKGENGDADFGTAMALSGDGNTVLVGGPYDSPQPGEIFPGGKGAVWAFTRSGSTWTQLGTKLTPKGESGYGNFGSAIAITRNGKTALIGGDNDAGGTTLPEGAVWVFKRSGSAFKQKGKKLVASPHNDDAFGSSIALTPDGKTALIGGPGYGNDAGRAFIYVRSKSSYKKKATLFPPGISLGCCPYFVGSSVGLSADGKIALLGTPGGAAGPKGQGEVFVYARSGSNYKLQTTLVPGDSVGQAEFAESLALTDDGKTALIGGPGDNGGAGAAWIFNRSGSTWTQSGSKLLSGDEKGDKTDFGSGVAMDPHASTLLIGASADEGNVGAVWLYTRAGSTLKRSKETGIGKEKGEREFGQSAAISADASTALVGGPLDHPGPPVGPIAKLPVGVGALWEFTIVR